MLRVLVSAEHTLMPRRRQLALKLLHQALEAWMPIPGYADRRSVLRLRRWLEPLAKKHDASTPLDQNTPDYYHLAGRFLDELDPYYEQVYDTRTRGVVRLKHLLDPLRKSPLSLGVIDQLVHETKELPPIANRVAACIVGVGEQGHPNEPIIQS